MNMMRGRVLGISTELNSEPIGADEPGKPAYYRNRHAARVTIELDRPLVTAEDHAALHSLFGRSVRIIVGDEAGSVRQAPHQDESTRVDG